MIPHCQVQHSPAVALEQQHQQQQPQQFATRSNSHSHNHAPLCIPTAAMDGSVNDRATKRQRGVHGEGGGDVETDKDIHSSDHTVSTASSTIYSGQSEATTLRSNSRCRKSVSFAPITAIHGCDWTQDEVDAGWYSKDELAVFKQERKSLVKVLKRVRFDLSQIDTTLHCLRGYEAYFSIQANKEYKFKRQMVWKAVLQEQARQRRLGRPDAMMMQLVTSHATQWARETATELGMQDAQVALQIFLEYMREQQEDEDCDDELEEYDASNGSNEEEEDFDDAPIAVNWNEEEEEEEFSGMALLETASQSGLELFSQLAPSNTSCLLHNQWNHQQLTLDNAGYNQRQHNHNRNITDRVS